MRIEDSRRIVRGCVLECMKGREGRAKGRRRCFTYENGYPVSHGPIDSCCEEEEVGDEEQFCEAAESHIFICWGSDDGGQWGKKGDNE